MAFLLKLHSAGRLSGDDRRRPCLSFATFNEAFESAREIFAYIAENTKAAGHGLKAPRVTIADSTGRGLFVGRLSSLQDPWGDVCFYMDCRQPGNATYKHWRDYVAIVEA